MEFVAILFMVIVLLVSQLILFTKNSFRHFEYTCFFTKDEVMEGDEVGLVEIVSNRKWFAPALAEIGTFHLSLAGIRRFSIRGSGRSAVCSQFFHAEKLSEGFPHLESPLSQARRF